MSTSAFIHTPKFHVLETLDDREEKRIQLENLLNMTVTRCKHVDRQTALHCPNFAIRAKFCDLHKEEGSEAKAEDVIGPYGSLDFKSGDSSWRHTCHAIDIDESLYKRNVITTDPIRLHRFYDVFRSKCPNEEFCAQAREQFFNERFLFHTQQAFRLLGEADMGTLEWLFQLYQGQAQASQPLPFPQTPIGFWSHLIQVEQTIRRVSLAWALPEGTSLIVGFMSRQDAAQRMKNAKSGAFLLRISNAEVGSLVLCIKTTQGAVRQESVKVCNLESLCAALEASSEAQCLHAELERDCLSKPRLLELLRDERYVVTRRNEYEEAVFAHLLI